MGEVSSFIVLLLILCIFLLVKRISRKSESGKARRKVPRSQFKKSSPLIQGKNQGCSKSREIVPQGSNFFEAQKISGRTAKLLFLTRDDPDQFATAFGMGVKISLSSSGVSCDTMDAADPSTIFTKLPIRPPRPNETVPRPSYYPSYRGLSPEQRWIYLSWLKDIRNPIDIGYVFVYYYGLERHLLLGHYDLAFHEILELRRHHKNSSFQSYSRCALVCSSLQRSESENLAHLYSQLDFKFVDNYDLLVAHMAKVGISPEGLMAAARRVPGISKRYMDSAADEFKAQLSTVLREEFQDEFFPIHSLYKIDDLPRMASIIYANISFPPDVRSPKLPDFFDYPPFRDEISTLMAKAHERTKQYLAEQRKLKRQKQR